MLTGAARPLLILFMSAAFPLAVSAQATSAGSTLKGIEPGLENAVKWKWRVIPSDDKNWGLELPTLPQPAAAPTPAALDPSEHQNTLYEVQRGDALILIAKKFAVTVAQIKQFNGLQGDKIFAGQILKIPGASQFQAMTPPPQAPASPTGEQPTENRTAVKTSVPESESKDVQLQVFLDREQFSAGPITDKPGDELRKVIFLYQSAHEEAKDEASLLARAEAELDKTFTTYKLKAEDFRFIAAPKA